MGMEHFYATVGTGMNGIAIFWRFFVKRREKYEIYTTDPKDFARGLIDTKCEDSFVEL